jgi:hypothetical protein
VYATIRHYPGNPGFADELAAREDEVLGIIRPVEGFRAYFLIRTADGTASVTVCDDQAGTDESNRAAADWIRQNMPDAVSTPPQITAGEVVISG